jgi:hypothetical protein
MIPISKVGSSQFWGLNIPPLSPWRLRISLVTGGLEGRYAVAGSDLLVEGVEDCDHVKQLVEQHDRSA